MCKDNALLSFHLNCYFFPACLIKRLTKAYSIFIKTYHEMESKKENWENYFPQHSVLQQLY